MKRYWVVGGEYADTSFSQLAPGKREERLGALAVEEGGTPGAADHPERVDERHRRRRRGEPAHELSQACVHAAILAQEADEGV